MEGKSVHRTFSESNKRPRLSIEGTKMAKRLRLGHPSETWRTEFTFPRPLREFQRGEMREAWNTMMRQSEQYDVRWMWNLLDLSTSERNTLAHVARRFHLLPELPFAHVSAVKLGPAQGDRVHVTVCFATDLTARLDELDRKRAFALFRLLSMFRQPDTVFDELDLLGEMDGDWSTE